MKYLGSGGQNALQLTTVDRVPRAMVRSRSPKGGDDGRRRSTPRRSSDEQGGRKEKGPISLLVRNIPHNCRYEDLRVPFAKFGPVRDIYMPKDYYSGEPKGFAFIEFFDSHDASEAQYHMNRKLFCGREIKVEPATDKRKRPEDMRRRTGVRSHSPAPRRRGDYSASPKRKEECQAKLSGQSKEHDNDKKLGSCTPGGRSERHDTDNYSNERDDYFTSSKRKGERLSKSLRLSKEHDKDKKRRSYSPDDRSDCRDADNSFKERRATTDGGKRSCPRQRSPRPSSGSHSRRRDAYSASPKGKEEHREQSPRQSKEHDKHRKRRSNTPDDRNDCHGADHSHNDYAIQNLCSYSPDLRMQGDCSTSPRIKEERQAKSSRESEEYNKDTKGAPHDRNDRHDAVNGSRDSNLHVDRKPVTPDDEGSHACWRSPRPSSGSCSRKRDDCSASPNKKEERRAKSPKQSIEYKDEKRRSCTADDMNGRHNAVNGYKKIDVFQSSYSAAPRRRDGYSASPKIKEECRAESPRPTKEREDNGGIDRTDADNGYNERRAGPDSASQKRMEKPPQAKSQSQSKEYDNGKENRSYTHDDGKECRNADNGSKVTNRFYTLLSQKGERTTQLLERERKSARQVYQDNQRNMMNIRRGDPILVMIEMTSVMLIMVPKKLLVFILYTVPRRRKDYSAAGKRKEERQASLPRQSKEHDEHTKRGCYTRDDRNDLCDADNGSKERKDYSAAGKRKEERQASLPRQSKEHDEHKKRGSYTPDDRDDPRDADNGSKERQGDFSASGQRKEEYRGKSPRQLKEHGDNKKRGSYTPADRNDLDNGCNEKMVFYFAFSEHPYIKRPLIGNATIYISYYRCWFLSVPHSDNGSWQHMTVAVAPALAGGRRDHLSSEDKTRACPND
ncbi:Serine/arginine-rich splicing factor 12 [Triticum urartu]|uniref:Serine/arginine-rich splicing factor 12 n=1 Tax=Triticum urartu TaxID=4572 RepID=M8A3Q6_TRIUA|nr:Serine/arginine-rich splicing factor 12 [Triticum urartu]